MPLDLLHSGLYVDPLLIECSEGLLNFVCISREIPHIVLKVVHSSRMICPEVSLSLKERGLCFLQLAPLFSYNFFYVLLRLWDLAILSDSLKD